MAHRVLRSSTVVVQVKITASPHQSLCLNQLGTFTYIYMYICYSDEEKKRCCVGRILFNMKYSSRSRNTWTKIKSKFMTIKVNMLSAIFRLIFIVEEETLLENERSIHYSCINDKLKWRMKLIVCLFCCEYCVNKGKEGSNLCSAIYHSAIVCAVAIYFHLYLLEHN